MPGRKILSLLLFVCVLAIPVGAPRAGENLLPYVEPNEEGLHVQPWFMNSFIDLREDLAEAAADGKQLLIIWEQMCCPDCLAMLRGNVLQPDTVVHIRAKFFVCQLNLWGDKEVTDVDGKVTTEKKLARKYRLQFTPTLQFFPKTLAKDNKKPGHKVEVWRLLGYWKPFDFKNTFRYVREESYKTEPNFQRWLLNVRQKMQAEG